MATVRQVFSRPPDQFDPIGSNFPQSLYTAGTNYVVPALAFDDTTSESCCTRLKASNYGSGNLTAILTWYADTATSGAVVWEVSISAVTPSSADNVNIETDSLATALTGTSSASGTAQELENVSITISNLDGLAADDIVELVIRRLPANGSDTMTGDALLVCVEINYSDS